MLRLAPWFSALRSGMPPLRGLLPLVVLLALWQAINPQGSPYFPPPSSWWTGLSVLAKSGRLGAALSSTLITFVLAIALSCVLGGLLGLLLGRSRAARRALGPTLEFFRGLPPPVIVPVAVLLLGYVQSLKLVVVVLVAIWPILLNTASATAAVSELLVEVSHTLRLGRVATLYKIIVPSAVPAFLVGVRSAIPLAIIITLLVEMLTSLPGVGSLIVISQRQFHSAEVYGLLIVVGLMGFVINAIFVTIEGVTLRRFPPRASYMHDN
ncbi:MAG TPA: ABC transporter permease subunit [Xanthobacteraceae bacterium]|jgi:ABC-type nitrate/sulfonate/bicarbonate transport system permease component|nr:ABC transporter permease subunit [Xanthobacteraceae bacterium]